MADKKITDLPANTNPSDAALYEVSDGAVSGKVLNTDIGQLRKVGTALIGGDFTGDARGEYALDLSTRRTAPHLVASGDYAVLVGYNSIASGTKSLSLGYGTIASGEYASAVGHASQAAGDYSTAIGNQAFASGLSSVAIGNAVSAQSVSSVAIGINSVANIDNVTVVAPPIATPRLTGSSFPTAGSVEVVLMTDAVDLKAVADVTLTIPTGAHFWLDEVGIIATVVDTMSVQPTIRFGITGTLAKQKAAAATTLLTAAHKRQSYAPLVPEDGETTLTAGVTVGATATEMKGRIYFKGILVIDQT